MSEQSIEFELLATDGAARSGRIYTRRGIIETPVFMPVGTAGTVKGMRFEALEDELDARIILGNTYHLWLRPGMEIIRACGGLHKFIGWDRAMLTDSGGFQVWSLTDLRRMNEEGVEFRSHIDGSKRFLSPEISMEIQATLGSEIVMVLDECPPGQATREVAKTSLEMTARWAQRSRNRFDELQAEVQSLSEVQSSKFKVQGEEVGGQRSEVSENQRSKFKDQSSNPQSAIRNPQLTGKQALFGIVQGAAHYDLRRESLQRTLEIGFDGYAIGGLSVGEEKAVMYDIIARLTPEMPTDKPRYLMGVGTPEDLVEAVYRGVDMFDCVMPTRSGRTGQAFTSRGKINIRNARYTTDTRPLDENCACSVCRRHSRAYLRHLNQAGEMLAGILLTHHNLAYFLDTMQRVRQAIRSHNFTRFRENFINNRTESVAD